MSFKLSIKTDNAAFTNEDTGEDAPHAEVARLLREVADRVEGGDDHGVIMDVNGNNVGTFSL